jgi:uncharacterized membrane protein
MFGHALVEAVEFWKSLYANDAAVRTLVSFVHVAGLIAGAGTAITADMAVLRTAPNGDRTSTLARLRSSHRIVIGGLALIVTSGLLLFASDVDTFAHSRFFWTKMALIGVLLANGAWMLRGERRAAHVPDDIHWRRLRITAVASAVLWLLTTLAGVALPNAG